MNQQDPTLDVISGLVGELTNVSVEDVVAQQNFELEGMPVAEPSRAEATPGPSLPTPTPFPPLPLLRPVSGRYRGSLGAFQLEFRIDVDRTRPMRKLSGDFYSVSGSTVTYFASFTVDSPAITVTAAQVTCRGLGRFTFAAGAPVVQVTIQRRTILQPPAAATVQFFTTAGSPGAQYTCAFESPYFRTVRIETDSVSDVTTPVFSSYGTGSLPSGGPTRTLSVISSYAEAGIQMIPASGADVVNISDAGANSTWSNSELHSSMEHHFSVFQNIPQWAVWQVVAQNHDLGPGLLGIMFDQIGPQRQGCAVFHRGLGGTTAQQLRLQLQTYVHELGHCFNLLHSWQKSLANPPGVDRPASLSWMNYPWRYPSGGEAAFWAAFAFQFDDLELVHLRHAFRNNIIMGANPFTVGSGLINPEIMSDPVTNQSNLRLEITPAHDKVALGEPVLLNLTLRATAPGTTVHPYLHPNLMSTTIVIAKPNGQVVTYEPVVDHLVGGKYQNLVPGAPVQDSAYIGFGKGGLYFDNPGNYEIRAIYSALDGSRILSNVAKLRVRYPVTAKQEDLADLLIGREQGMLFYLLGSDADSLESGRRALQTVLDRYGDDRVADYVRIVMGVNAARTFKTIVEDRETRLHIRSADVAAAAELIGTAVRPDSPVDPISKAQMLNKLAGAQRRAGDDQGARNAEDLAANLLGEVSATAARAA